MLSKFCNNFYKSGPLSRRNPLQGQSVRVNLKIVQNTPDQMKLVNGFVITVPVMTLAQVSAAHKDAVSPIHKTIHQKNSVYSSRAHYPDDADMRRILKTRHPGRISCGIATPVA